MKVVVFVSLALPWDDYDLAALTKIYCMLKIGTPGVTLPVYGSKTASAPRQPPDVLAVKISMAVVDRVLKSTTPSSRQLRNDAS
jgi:hypothetical protein